ncbi:MAG: type II toxin-antitoxin system HicB family antitoxin [Chloroflexota bacterium]
MMEYKGYIGKVEFDDEADIFHGEVVNLRDIITFQGESVRESRQAFEESIEDYLEFCAKLEEDPQQPPYELFEQWHIALLNQGFNLGTNGQIDWSRESLYER